MTELHSTGDRKSKTKARAAHLFRQAEKEWHRNNARSALRLYISAAAAGDIGALLNVGYFYDQGIGTRRNQATAMYWYKRAWRHRHPAAANNLGTIWRDRGQVLHALTWFHKAAKLGYEGANLEIAKHYILNQDPRKAIACLNRVIRSSRVSEADVEEAKSLLARIKKE